MQISKPYILVQDDIPVDGTSPLRTMNMECDCAPAFQISRPRPVADVNTLLTHSDVYRGLLPTRHTFLVNSMENTELVVANDAAHRIWNAFDVPRTANSLRDEYGQGVENLALRFYRYGLLKVFGETRPLQNKAPQILSAWIHITNECNLRCTYCYMDKTAQSMKREVGIASVDAVIRSAVNGGFGGIRLKFAGGEPTLNYRLILELDDYARGQAENIGLVYDAVVLTNGTILSERQACEFQSRGIRVMISLDGLEETHDRQRAFPNGAGSFRMIVRSLERLKRIGLTPFISVTVTGNNVHDLPDTVAFLLEQDYPFNLNFVRDLTKLDADLHLENQKLIHYIVQSFGNIEKRLPSFSLLNVLLDRSNLSYLHNKTCGVGDSYMAINHLGQIAKCHAEINKPLASISDPDPLQILKEDKNQFRNISVDEKKGCQACQWRYWCAGGCPLLTYKTTGNYDVKSPYCDVYQAVYPALLRLEGLRLMKFGGIPIGI
jgi:uncharacterized protein